MWSPTSGDSLKNITWLSNFLSHCDKTRTRPWHKPYEYDVSSIKSSDSGRSRVFVCGSKELPLQVESLEGRERSLELDWTLGCGWKGERDRWWGEGFKYLSMLVPSYYCSMMEQS